MSTIAFNPEGLLGLQNSNIPVQLLNTESKAKRLDVNLRSLASLKIHIVLHYFLVIQNMYITQTYLFLSIIPNL